MSPANVAQVLADLRRTHAQLKANQSDNAETPVYQWSMRLTLEEVDVLLAIVDERDVLRRQLCDMPDEAREREAVSGREAREAPPHADLFDQDAPPPLPLRVEGFTTEYATCYLCDGHLVRYGAGEWQHTVNVRAAHAGIPSADEKPIESATPPHPGVLGTHVPETCEPCRVFLANGDPTFGGIEPNA